MKIVGIPLDIRPYNYDFLYSLAKMDSQVTIKLPPKEVLGFKKVPADHSAVKHFIKNEITDADALIMSLDMYIYGGLFPSRVHVTPAAELLAKFESLRDLKQREPALKIYASSLVLRTPSYNSSEEEPEYYRYCGADIYHYGYLIDKHQRQGLKKEDRDLAAELRARIGESNLEDWLHRREINRTVTRAAIQLVAEGILERLVIPLDDTSEFGFTAVDQSLIYNWITDYHVQDRVHVHPGTDETGCTLLTRAYLDHKKMPFIATTLCSNEDFFQLIPNYEDRPFKYSLDSHARACGITFVAENQHAPVLAINGCGEKMQEAAEVSYGYHVHTGSKTTPYKNVTYYTHRNLFGFVAEIGKKINSRKIVIADVAFSNGGETELIELLDKSHILDKLSGYAGWNTTCNTLGTALAVLVFSSCGNNRQAVSEFLIERIMSDWAYQTEVRFPIQCEFLPQVGATYSDFEHVETDVFNEIKNQLYSTWHKHITHFSKGKIPTISCITAPFKRLSGIYIALNKSL